MFDKLQRQFKQFEQVIKISAELPIDDEGYLRHQYASEPCHAAFKVDNAP
jgi:hypothetical protein